MQLNTIEYIAIATEGDAVDFGNLTVVRHLGSACSNSHRRSRIMGILRTDIISHFRWSKCHQRICIFDGDGDDLTFTTTSALSLDSDFTIEFYIFNNTIALDTQHPSPVTMPAESGHNSDLYKFIW